MKVLIIIPAYNEERNIKRVIEDLNRFYSSKDLLVVNDGSFDGTSEIAKQCGCRVIDLPCNLGVGGAVQTGIKFAKENGYDAAIQFDGDGQHRAEYIDKLIEALSYADLSIGSRFLGGNSFDSSLFRGIGIKFFSLLVSILTGKRFTDTTSGFRAFGKRAIDLFYDYYPVDYPEVESILYANSNKLKIAEIPVLMNQRIEGRSSITPVKSVYYALKVTLALLLKP
ncbi:Undecaprenyl-phosphate mannosyltransferase [Caloramator mitchellensis]|uniref:Undecaprenyl-phosphate mannosyltransferase n=1 Tax=Caloramator mitchellensis TaxID=908809 RepID=A0A0R3JW52_CALMK|nr:glycosyltransferase family 2 protein [Caloramator mitchellensis]KRQ87763.1 Undecaprenyl-phosphate mannosyltransferase [Caloramator mitchellensis]